MSLVKVIKKEQSEATALRAEVESAEEPNKWAKEVRSWVGEFRNNRRVENLPAFDSLFKDTGA